MVVDHNPLLREGLGVLVRSQPDMELTAAVATGKDAVRSFSRYKPDVTLMDLDLPFREGIIAIERIREVDPTTHILGLVTSEWDDVGREAVRAGARCCLSKDRLNEELV